MNDLKGRWVNVPGRASQGVIVGSYKFQGEVWVWLFFPRLGGPTVIYKLDKIEVDYSKERSWDSAGNALTKPEGN